MVNNMNANTFIMYMYIITVLLFRVTDYIS